MFTTCDTLRLESTSSRRGIVDFPDTDIELERAGQGPSPHWSKQLTIINCLYYGETTASVSCQFRNVDRPNSGSILNGSGRDNSLALTGLLRPVLPEARS